jgi:hypothetical protein
MRIWSKCPRCRHLCRYELAPDSDDLLLLVGPDCDYCENKRSVVVSLGTLAANLAAAGALCRAWEMGRRNGHDGACEDEGYQPYYGTDGQWEPGCVLDAVAREGRA